MRYFIIILLVVSNFSCSHETRKTPVREFELIEQEMEVYGSNNSLIGEMFTWNYDMSYPQYVDDFCRLNPAYCELTKLSEVPVERSDPEGWHYHGSLATGKVYKYLMRKGDNVVLPHYRRKK